MLKQLLIVFCWFAAASVIGVAVAELNGLGHGSIADVIVAWYAAGIGAVTHLLIRILRRNESDSLQ